MINNELISDLEKIYGLNTNLEDRLVDEISKSINKSIIDNLFKIEKEKRIKLREKRRLRIEKLNRILND